MRGHIIKYALISLGPRSNSGLLTFLDILISSYTDSVDYPSYLREKEKINYKIMKILREEDIELAYDTKTVYMKQD